jgi:leader peptidase (prepilin peptidase)/N-methyltransferase
MGYGDFKLLALLGAWLGWQALPACILIASLVGTVYGVGVILTGRRSREQPFPFGPFLALAGWVNLMWGEALRAAYLNMLQ